MLLSGQAFSGAGLALLGHVLTGSHAPIREVGDTVAMLAAYPIGDALGAIVTSNLRRVEKLRSISRTERLSFFGIAQVALETPHEQEHADRQGYDHQTLQESLHRFRLGDSIPQNWGLVYAE